MSPPTTTLPTSLPSPTDEVADLVQAFVADLPQRATELSRRAHACDWLAVRHGAHQLRGTAGAFGFAGLMSAAGELERSLGANVSEQRRRDALSELLAVCDSLTNDQDRP